MAKSRFTVQYDRFLVRLKALRSQKGVSQVELARRLGVPQQYISRFETGETRMDVVQLWQFCRALGVNFDRVCKQLDRVFAHAAGPRRQNNR
ncbi:MAG: helix-turn-helix transcriptional regulator [Planctomycetota bacterium]|nr:helix-turn-helix transcriptional regulator [Planctomycetota bacterium]